MVTGKRKIVAMAFFAVILIALVNLAWWFFYQNTEQILDRQLSRRLAAVAQTASPAITPQITADLLAGDLNAYQKSWEILERTRQADSLAEVFILDERFRYLATTSLEDDSIYFLRRLNGPYIDSVFFGPPRQTLVTPSYQTGSAYLRTAFVPLTDSSDYVLAILGVEANVDYFDSLAELKRNLLYSAVLSIVGGLFFGLLFLAYQRRINRIEHQLYLNQTHSYLGRMVAVVSHEIKNPLMIIRASAERLGKKFDAPESQFVIEEVDRLNQIVTGYLDFARAGSGAPSDSDHFLLTTEQPQPVNLKELTANLKRHFQDKYEQHQVTWLDSSTGENLSITTYPRALRQILFNLLINGAEACLGAGLPVKVGIVAEDRGSRVLLRVVDHGPGMNKRELKEAFEPFFTTKHSGTGLGLYVSRKIVAEMGGDLDIESAPGEKTELKINLPKNPGQ